MKVSLITETFPPEINGVAMTLHQVVEGLIDRGHQLEVICPRREDRSLFFAQPRFKMEMVPGFPLPRYPDLRFGLPAHRSIRRIWKNERPDLVHIATEGPLGWSAERIAHEMGIPVITTFHTNFHAYTSAYGIGRLENFAVWWMRRMRRRVKRTFVPSEEIAQTLHSHGFQHLSILSRGVDTTLFSPQRRDPELRKRWGVDDDTPVAIYVGRLAAEKNLPLTCQAWDTMRKALPHIRLVVVGDGPEKASMAKSHPEIIFAGSQRGEDLARHYASGDVFIFASTTETFGNVVTEAMASGLLVLAYDYAAAHRYIENGVNGYTVPFGDAAAFLAAAETLSQSPASWPRLRSAARCTSEAISWDSVIDGFAREIEALVSPTKPSPV